MHTGKPVANTQMVQTRYQGHRLLHEIVEKKLAIQILHDTFSTHNGPFHFHDVP